MIGCMVEELCVYADLKDFFGRLGIESLNTNLNSCNSGDNNMNRSKWNPFLFLKQRKSLKLTIHGFS